METLLDGIRRTFQGRKQDRNRRTTLVNRTIKSKEESNKEMQNVCFRYNVSFNKQENTPPTKAIAKVVFISCVSNINAK
ncbi:Uncharacterized protein APZ42_002903 [Daphnia magna]|uniref:Uncharacterized protein n=1 Tax=Daphnia magna TaxID=35525 RepID=A0A0N8EI42_9CRUS|nr:Uncharacterized protein APZ42_002903 [Daphnia magna]